MKVLVTGASGFVGRALCAELSRQGFSVRAAIRSANARINLAEPALVGSIDGSTDWSAALRGVDAVIHLAARVHVMKEDCADPLAEFLKVNLHGTENLAIQAARAGIKRLVYVSSIKVNGEQTREGQPFRESDEPSPQDPYGVSKHEAEKALQRIAAETPMKVVIVRLPLVYGPEVGGNFLRLLKLVDRSVPLPFASIRNQRSMLYLGNFVDALIVCAVHPNAGGKTYIVSDGETISTPQLIRELARLMEKPAHLWPFPTGLLKFAGLLFGKVDEIDRLIGSLVIDSSKFRDELGWVPPYSMEQGLAVTAKWFQQRGGGV